jgi:phosphatidylinositol glycan class B
MRSFIHNHQNTTLLTTLQIVFAVLCYAFASYYLVYCLHLDEHFQIIEFANFKRGLLSQDQLAWEYHARLRPSLQPALAYVLLNTMSFSGLTDPFSQAIVLRFLSALFFIFCSFRLYKSLGIEIKSAAFRYLFLFLSFFFYFFPISGTRFSSENTSACFFMLGFAYLYPLVRQVKLQRISPLQLLLAGVLFGISFLFRYQSAIMTAGLAMWLLVLHYRLISSWLLMFGGFLLVFLVGILIDRWFYSEWVFSAWNYFYVNLIEGKAANFGVQPWHHYLGAIDLSKWIRFVNLPVIGLLLFFLFTRPVHVVCWIFFPFLLFHFAVTHKETRFLYPILVFIPFLVSFSLAKIYSGLGRYRFFLLPFLGIALLINCAAFVSTTFTNSNNTIEIFKYIRVLENKPVKIYYDTPEFFYTLNDGTKDLTPTFYKDDHQVIMVKKQPGMLERISEIPVHSDTLSFVILDRWEEEKMKVKLPMVFDPQAGLVRTLNYRNWMRQHYQWKLYQLKPDAKD